MAAKVRWGDSIDFDDEESDQEIEAVDDKSLPPIQVLGPDEKGIKTIIEYSFNDAGQKVKVVKKVRNKREKRSKKVLERRNWAKFGDAKGLGSEQEHRTMVSTEEIWIERRGLQAEKEAAEKKAADPLGQLAQQGNTSLMVCRVCGKKGDHWSAQCPYKDLAANSGDFGAKAPEDGERPGSSSGKPGTYVPPSRREGATAREGSEMGGGRGGRGRDDNSIRVTNLSEDTREEDLQELFRPFGPISRIYVAFDRETKQSRGFAFINFVNREDAQQAIRKLDGYGYDNLILRVEWATPREAKG
eukprot:TRINITY_DN18410_c0_g1_i1.p1 TRINITY_DN18410_c0_g1~~TRINITY_DN18410_c0_g1_i1.p1  ORF type:complete len:301 (+),score=109.97 TRINITY_DN18410_c0_g1_i1:227-1129(+)